MNKIFSTKNINKTLILDLSDKKSSKKFEDFFRSNLRDEFNLIQFNKAQFTNNILRYYFMEKNKFEKITLRHNDPNKNITKIIKTTINVNIKNSTSDKNIISFSSLEDITITIQALSLVEKRILYLSQTGTGLNVPINIKRYFGVPETELLKQKEDNKKDLKPDEYFFEPNNSLKKFYDMINIYINKQMEKI